MFRLAHLADPHVSPLPPPSASELCNKRALGYLSWQLRRKQVHRREVLEALSRDVVAEAPDHVAVVGDLTNIALHAEFAPALDWLRSLGDSRNVSVVPGNHDAYVKMPWSDTIDSWSAYMTSDNGAHSSDDADHGFPWARVRGCVALVGVNTALATLPLLATGTAGARQLRRLEALLARMGVAGLFRVVLIHHPPIDSLTKRRKRLVDSAEFARVIRRVGAELILHGHTHESTVAYLRSVRAEVPVIGVTSSSSNGGEDRSLRARYNVYAIEACEDRWRVNMQVRAWNEDGHVSEIEHAPLRPYL
jgi:3',5'-cyclic AMP phosphodiesterase CpdA